MGKRVLVTGAGGFIGSHLVELLVREGHEVRAFLRYNGRDDRGQIDRLPATVQAAIEVHRGDLKDPEAVRKAVEGQRVGLPPRGLDRDPGIRIRTRSSVVQNTTSSAPPQRARRPAGAAISLERVSASTQRPRFTAPRNSCLSPRRTRSGASPLTPRPRSAPIRSVRVITGRSASRWRSSEPFRSVRPTRQSARAIHPRRSLARRSRSREIRLGSLDPRRDLTYVKDTARGFLELARCDAAIGRVVNIGRGDDLADRQACRADRQDPRAGRSEVETDEARVSALPQAKLADYSPGRHWPRNCSAGLHSTRLTRAWRRRSRGSAKTSGCSGSTARRPVDPARRRRRGEPRQPDSDADVCPPRRAPAAPLHPRPRGARGAGPPPRVERAAEGSRMSSRHGRGRSPTG